MLAINAASAALMISGIPFEGPIGAVRMAYTTDGEWAAAPDLPEGDAATFELVVAGRALSDSVDADVAIMMVEAGGTDGSFEKYADGAPKVTEEVLAEGLEASKPWIRESINLQRELVAALRGRARPDHADRVRGQADYQRRRLRARRGGGRRRRWRRRTPSRPRPSATSALDAATGVDHRAR